MIAISAKKARPFEQKPDDAEIPPFFAGLARQLAFVVSDMGVSPWNRCQATRLSPEAAMIASFVVSCENSATMRPRRMTMMRCAMARHSSTSDVE